MKFTETQIIAAARAMCDKDAVKPLNADAVWCACAPSYISDARAALGAVESALVDACGRGHSEALVHLADARAKGYAMGRQSIAPTTPDARTVIMREALTQIAQLDCRLGASSSMVLARHALNKCATLEKGVANPFSVLRYESTRDNHSAFKGHVPLVVKPKVDPVAEARKVIAKHANVQACSWWAPQSGLVVVQIYTYNGSSIRWQYAAANEVQQLALLLQCL